MNRESSASDYLDGACPDPGYCAWQGRGSSDHVQVDNRLPELVRAAHAHAAPGTEFSTIRPYGKRPRDLTLIVGDTIIETPSSVRARYHELDGLRELFHRYLRAGSPWLSAPKPQLRDELYEVEADGLPALGELEPAFEEVILG